MESNRWDFKKNKTKQKLTTIDLQQNRGDLGPCIVPRIPHIETRRDHLQNKQANKQTRMFAQKVEDIKQHRFKEGLLKVRDDKK
jgi:hypothetical protein